MYVYMCQATGKSMCIHVYICIHVGCTCIYVRNHIHVRVYVSGYSQEYVYTCVYLYTCRMYVYICQESRICTLMYGRLQARVCVYMLC